MARVSLTLAFLLECFVVFYVSPTAGGEAGGKKLLHQTPVLVDYICILSITATKSLYCCTLHDSLSLYSMTQAAGL